ncbi:virulence factor MVIN family protein [Vibrio cholerae]|nr:virulence factor MVIN family protein [Vibrio cholerae]GHY77457.1 virulence factor MVIN family protein [Vibrio cholerae]
MLIFLGKLTGLSKDILATAFFGVSLNTDAFFLATYISTLLYIALYGSISLVVIPAYQAYKSHGVGKGSLNFVIIILLLASIFLSIISYHYSFSIVGFFYQGGYEGFILTSSKYLKLMVVTYPLSTCVGILNAISSAKSKPIYVYLNPIINNVSFCLFVYLFGESGTFEPILLGAIATWFILLVMNIFGYKNILNQLRSLWRDVSPNSGLLLVSGVSISFSLVEQIVNFIPVYISSSFGDGAISYYSIASKLTLLFLSLSSLIISSHVYPKFSKMESLDSIRELINQYLPLLLSFLFSIVSFSIVFAEQLIKLVFERGQFNSNDAHNVAMVFSVIVVMIPFVLIKDLSTKALFAQGKGLSCFKSILIFSIIITGFSILVVKYFDFVVSLIVYVFLVIVFSLHMYFKLFASGQVNKMVTIIFLSMKYFIISIVLSLAVFYTVDGFYISVFLYLIGYSFFMFVTKDDSFLKLYRMLSRRNNEKTV